MDKVITELLNSGNEAIIAYTKRDLLGEKVNTDFIKDLPRVKRIISKQEKDGRWAYPGNKGKMQRGYDQYFTMKMLGELVQKYGLTKKHEAVSKAREFLQSTQTKEGDYRGIYANQYSPNYSANIMEFLIMAGYDVNKGLNWLLSIRQDDGGWAIPIRTVKKMPWTEWVNIKEAVEPDRSKKFSHFCTGISLRPFSLIKKYHKKLYNTAILYADSFFERDNYPDRSGIEFWTHFTYPYQWADILNGLDTLSRIGIKKHPKITQALNWFKKHKKSNGLWNIHKVMGANDKDSNCWINLQIARVLKRF